VEDEKAVVVVIKPVDKEDEFGGKGADDDVEGKEKKEVQAGGLEEHT